MAELELFIVDKNDTSWSLRPWLVLVHNDIPFVQTSYVAADPDTPAKIRAVSPTGRVPVLRVDKRFVWESLAIIETLADLFPDRPIWPRDAEQRMHARSIAAEMHAGFVEVRRHCPMNLALRTRVELDPARRRELDRFERLVEGARDASDAAGGPFLFGEFSAADAMLAPVATRVVSYGLDVGRATRAWIEAVYALPAFQRWEQEAEAERRVRPVAARIGVPFTGSVQERIVGGPCYAVIFSNQHRGEESEYAATANRMVELAASMPGFLSYESTRAANGFGITVSYWSSLEAIEGWRKHAEHAVAQEVGRDRFYASYNLRIARVERHVSFDISKNPPRTEHYV